MMRFLNRVTVSKNSTQPNEGSSSGVPDVGNEKPQDLSFIPREILQNPSWYENHKLLAWQRIIVESYLNLSFSKALIQLLATDDNALVSYLGAPNSKKVWCQCTILTYAQFD